MKTRAVCSKTSAVVAPRDDNDNSLAQLENTYLQKNHSAKTYKKKRDGRQTGGQTETGDLFLSYPTGHERSRKCKGRESADGLDYNTSFAYAWKVKIMS